MGLTPRPLLVLTMLKKTALFLFEGFPNDQLEGLIISVRNLDDPDINDCTTNATELKIFSRVL